MKLLSLVHGRLVPPYAIPTYNAPALRPAVLQLAQREYEVSQRELGVRSAEEMAQRFSTKEEALRQHEHELQSREVVLVRTQHAADQVGPWRGVAQTEGARCGLR